MLGGNAYLFHIKFMVPFFLNTGTVTVIRMDLEQIKNLLLHKFNVQVIRNIMTLGITSHRVQGL